MELVKAVSKEPRFAALFCTLLPLIGASFFDAADSDYFNGLMRVFEVQLQMTMLNIGAMTIAMTLATVIFLPVWGAIADSGVISGKMLLVVSSAGWGTSSILAAGFARSLPQLLVLRFTMAAFLCSGLLSDFGWLGGI